MISGYHRVEIDHKIDAPFLDQKNYSESDNEKIADLNYSNQKIPSKTLEKMTKKLKHLFGRS